MALDSCTWATIGSNFDPDEETANFATRKALEAGGKLFDVFTYAIIEPQGEVLSNPHVLSRSSNVSLALSLDSCLHIFGQDFKSDEVSTFRFSENVDAIAWTPCGRFMIAGLGSGHVRLIHVSSQKLLPPIPLGEKNDSNGRKFVSAFTIGSQSECMIKLFSTDGKVFLISKVNLDALDTGILSGDFVRVGEFRNAIEFSEVHYLKDFDVEAVTSYKDEMNNHRLLVAYGGGRFGSLNDSKILDEVQVFEDCPDKILSIHVPKIAGRRNVAFCVQGSGALSVICLHTMVLLTKWTQEQVLDLALIEDEGDVSVKLMMITQRPTFGLETGSKETLLQIRDYPSFCVLYELTVSQFCRIIDVATNQDSPMILEGSSKLIRGVITGLRIRGICEGSAEARLTRLLRRKKFEEAEKFALSNKLCMDEIRKARAMDLMEKLSPWNPQQSNNSIIDLFDEFKKILTSMTDLEYMVRCCIEAAMPTLQMIKDLLLLARSSVQRDPNHSMDSDLLAQVCNTLHRLETFTFVQNAVEKGPQVDELGKINSWVEFLSVDMLDECCERLANGQLRPAILIWKRHQAEFANSLTCSLVGDLLSEISKKWSINAKLAWLSNFIPDCLNIMPDCLPDIAQWTIDATKELEFNDWKSWPSNGLKFATSVMETLVIFGMEGNAEVSDFKSSKVLMIVHQQKTDTTSSLYKLTHLIETLNDLKTLHEKFRFRMKLAEFDACSKEDVVDNILNWFQSPCEVDSVVNDFLTGYMRKHKLDIDKVLAHYCKRIIENSGFCWYWEAGIAPWEEKVQVLLRYIKHGTKTYSKLALLCLQSAPVPWSPIIHQVCEDSKKTAVQSIIEQITEQEKLVVLKQILRKYDVRSFSVTGRESERLLQHIIKRGASQEEMLKVAELVGTTEKSDALKYFTQHLIETNQHNRAVDVLIGVSNKTDAKVLATKLLIHAEMTFLCLHTVQPDLPQKLFLKAASIAIRQFKILDDESIEWFEESSDLLCRQFSIWEGFGVKASADEMVEPYVEDLLLKILEKEFRDMKEVVFTRLQLLGNLTRIPIEECIGHLLGIIAKRGDFNGFVHVVKEMIIFKSICLTSRMAELAITAVVILMDKLRDDDFCQDATFYDDLLRCFSHLASWSATVCDERFLETSEFVSKVQYYLSQIQKELHNQRVLDEVELSVDTYSKAKFAPSYQDKGLPLDPQVLNTPLNLASYLIDSTAKSLDLLPNLAFCKQGHTLESEKEVSKKEEEILHFHSLLRQHASELATLGHASLSITCIGMFSFQLIANALRYGEDLSNRLASGLKEDLVKTVGLVIPKVISERKPDLSLALGYLLSTDSGPGSPSTALKIILTTQGMFGLDYRRIFFTGFLGMQFCRKKDTCGLIREIEKFKIVCTTSSWAKHFKDLKINFNFPLTFGKRDPEVLYNLLKELVEKSISDPCIKVCLEDHLNFANAFGLCEGRVRQEFVNSCVTSTALEATLNNDNQVVLPENFEQVMEEVNKALSMDFVAQSALEFSVFFPPFFDEISPYNYEVLQVLINKYVEVFQDLITEQGDMTGNREMLLCTGYQELERTQNILQFFVTYKRCNPPSEVEISPWIDNFKRPFPKIAFHRLPVHQLLSLSGRDVFRYLSTEFQLSSYKLWIEASETFKILPERIRVVAGQSTFPILSSKLTDMDSFHVWNLKSDHSDLLDELMECIMALKDTQWLSALLNGVTSRLGSGVDKLRMSRLFSEFAESWNDLSGQEDSKRGLTFAWKIQFQTELLNILALHGLIATNLNHSPEMLEAGKQFLDLIQLEKYDELIIRLYEHESIVTRCKTVGSSAVTSTSSSYPDINGVVDEIVRLSETCKAAEYQGINAEKVRQIKFNRLLDLWLPEKNSSSHNMDETITNLDFMQNIGAAPVNSENLSKENEQNFLRCVYILQGCSGNEGYDYLLQIALSRDSSYTTMHKLRATKCILSASNSTDLEFLDDFHGGGDDFGVQHYLKALMFVARLEKLNLTYDLKAFVNCKKPSLIESLLKSCGHVPDGLSLIVDLCLAYDYFPTKLWSALLKQMSQLGLHNHLRQVLFELNRHPHTWHLPAFLDAWNKILMQPFVTATIPVTAETERLCANSLDLLQQCPIASDVNVQGILGECRRLNLVKLEGQCVQLINLINPELIISNKDRA